VCVVGILQVAFGDRVVHDLSKHAKEMEERPPVLKQFDSWGQYVTVFAMPSTAFCCVVFDWWVLC
jgi:hypothetical protein